MSASPAHEQACAIALVVLARVNPGRLSVCLCVEETPAPVFVIWTHLRGRLHEHRLDAASTTAERLEAHLRGFCDNVSGMPL